MTATKNYGNYLNCYSPSFKKGLNTPKSSAKLVKDVKILKIEASPGKCFTFFLQFLGIFDSPKSLYGKTQIYSGAIEALNIIPKSIRISC